jgi:repressor LexA
MARPLCSVLTNAHWKVLDAIERLSRKGLPPSVGEIALSLRMAGQTSLTPTLRIMQRNDFVEIHGGGRRGKRRTVTLTARGKTSLGIGGLPVLGTIPAGPLSESLSQAETVLDEQELLACRPGDFLLIIEGDSMIGDGILPGDKVLIRPNIEPRNGEIAAVQVGGDYRATLKHVRFTTGRRKITLEASNSNYRPLTVPARDLRIAGVYRGLVRSAN